MAVSEWQDQVKKLGGLRAYIEERFLRFVARLVRRSERGRKGRATSVGMTISLVGSDVVVMLGGTAWGATGVEDGE